MAAPSFLSLMQSEIASGQNDTNGDRKRLDIIKVFPRSCASPLCFSMMFQKACITIISSELMIISQQSDFPLLLKTQISKGS